MSAGKKKKYSGRGELPDKHRGPEKNIIVRKTLTFVPSLMVQLEGKYKVWFLQLIILLAINVFNVSFSDLCP